jgi:hypothetical protein
MKSNLFQTFLATPAYAQWASMKEERAAQGDRVIAAPVTVKLTGKAKK